MCVRVEGRFFFYGNVRRVGYAFFLFVFGKFVYFFIMRFIDVVGYFLGFRYCF